jgi:broad specificity phosphatase PhoE
VDDDLQECAYGACTGRALKDLAKEPLWRTVQDDPETARFPPYDRNAA